MERKPFIVIADRNPHVRRFLWRELLAEGYRVSVIENGTRLLTMTREKEIPDLLILDPDLPNIEAFESVQTPQNPHLAFPIVIHSLIQDYRLHADALPSAIFIEKSGDSISEIKECVRKLFT